MQIFGTYGSQHRDDDCRKPGNVFYRAERREFLTEQRLVARLAVSRTQLRFRHPRERLWKAERAGQLWIIKILFRVTVGAAAIGIDPRRQQEPLTQRQEFFLREEAEVLHALPLLEHPDIGSRADDSQSADEVSTHDTRGAKVPARAVDADRRRRRECSAPWRERQHRAAAEVEVHVVAVAEERCARLTIVYRLELELGWKQQRVLLIELVGAAVQVEFQAVGLLLNRGQRQPARENRPQNFFVVLHQRRSLQRVADHERIRRISSVGLAAQVHEIRSERKHHPEAHAGVVVVGESALRQ